MTHIICRAPNCLFWDEGVCGSEEIEYEPDTGCLTFQDIGDLELEQEDDEEFDWDEEDEGDLYDDEGDDDDWDDEEDDWDDDLDL
jgi:DNA-directed RNA polymerase subunit delta